MASSLMDKEKGSGVEEKEEGRKEGELIYDVGSHPPVHIILVYAIQVNLSMTSIPYLQKTPSLSMLSRFLVYRYDVSPHPPVYRRRELYHGRRHVVVLLRTVSLIRHRVDKCMDMGRAVSWYPYT